MDIYFLDLNNFSKNLLENFIKDCIEEKIFSNELKKQQHYAGKFLLKYVLEKEYDISKFETEIRGGKPFLKDLPYYYSISHSENIVGLAIGDKIVGFDIECNKKVRNFEAISLRYGEKIVEQTEFYHHLNTQHQPECLQ